MKWRPYLPSVVLVCWAVFSEFADGELTPVWLLAFAIALAVMVATLSQRYSRDNGRERS